MADFKGRVQVKVYLRLPLDMVDGCPAGCWSEAGQCICLDGILLVELQKFKLPLLSYRYGLFWRSAISPSCLGYTFLFFEARCSPSLQRGCRSHRQIHQQEHAYRNWIYAGVVVHLVCAHMGDVDLALLSTVSLELDVRSKLWILLRWSV